MDIHRLYVEKKPPFDQEARRLCEDLKSQLDLKSLHRVRIIQRYDVSGIRQATWAVAISGVFSEPQVDAVNNGLVLNPIQETAFAVEYLPGQFDQRADSAEQCLRILDPEAQPRVAHATIYVLRGGLSAVDIQRAKNYLINPVDSREASLESRQTLETSVPEPGETAVLEGFITASREQLSSRLLDWGLAMGLPDLEYCQAYFRDQEKREPTETEIRVLDTYWSDHCRHTTFLTHIASIDWGDLPGESPLRRSYERYREVRAALYGDAAGERPETLMDLATIGAKWLRRQGLLEDLEVSEEVNAASMAVPVEFDDGTTEKWLVMFKNETHNHPTEIEPFGGAATCLGGAIRDPLSGRSYVYQAMRVSGAGDPRTPFTDTLPGKLPQRVITTQAAAGYSSYGNQIGLATGMVSEVYHPGYVTKRMEIGAVIGAAPRDWVVRERPAPGDIILLVGGKTGRDGVGGATGSSKQHTDSALENTAEVQKGNPPVERALQRLFRNPEATRLIKRCNDFGAGGVSVAIGELAPSLEVNLDAVPRKYEGLSGTDLAISESQERMAVCLAPEHADAFIRMAAGENLDAVPVARVTDSGRLVLKWQGKAIVDLQRSFLDTNGVPQFAGVAFTAPSGSAPDRIAEPTSPSLSGQELRDKWLQTLGDLNVCSQQGLVECFDSTIGSGSILHPLGGSAQVTPVEAMAARIPSLDKTACTCTLMSWGFDPALSAQSPFHGALYAVVHAVARVVAAGADPARVRLTFQEYFERLRTDPTRWAKPFSALLGGLTAQLELGMPAVGGKDSMSGSFNEMDVPPTLVAFAVGLAEDRYIMSPEFKSTDSSLWLLEAPTAEDGLPDWAGLRALFRYVYEQSRQGTLEAVAAPGIGGIAAALSRMAFGNGIGVRLDPAIEALDLFAPRHGAFLVEAEELPESAAFRFVAVGRTTEEPAISQGDDLNMPLRELERAWKQPLESIFPTQAPAPEPGGSLYTWNDSAARPRKGPSASKPAVVIPAFPGTNCEWDSARAFIRAGADPRIFLFRNRSERDIRDSLKELADALDKAHMLMLPGGFSAGDEPEGSGKFICSVFRSPRVADATMRLLKERDGLILGICNGFQALVKLGLLPFGEIREMDAGCPTLTFNVIGRHVSRYVHTRVCSSLSPWLQLCQPGEVHTLPVSHGEGRFYADRSVLRTLASAGQIATQYVDARGRLSPEADVNPNGSVDAIEAISSADGRILGKMAHSERIGPLVGKNIPGNKDQRLFEAGVRYFSD